MVRVILKERGQITIPAKLRKNMMLKVGDLLEVEVRGNHLVLKPLHVMERSEDISGGSTEEPGP